MESDTCTLVSAHPNIIFTHADKGNITVVMDKDAYMNKMTTLLSDVDTYVLVNKDPAKKLTTALRSMLTRWKTKNYISDTKYRTLYRSDGSLPKVYGLPKIHKPGCLLRVIVSSIGSPLRQLDHEFQWDEVVILDEEPCYRRHLVSEMLNIRKQKNGLNLQTDTDGLYKASIPIINKVDFLILTVRLFSQSVLISITERT
ncbi:PREDICTED: uncharacterized protein LOC108754279 [Trachymyrmex septentrionalis]|uniref:uncharacterized protein LOC108754279 n=1 Tax=Trachymyrmex septentrionalis TaxID=34720 RepID=UPI00084F5AEA|nr:PREDICTED: uncharacterized protein LOC108754279 [Trachymyrmex septentrionalis]